MRKISQVQLVALIGVAFIFFASTRPWATANLSATSGPALHLKFTGRQLDALPAALAALSLVLVLVIGATRTVIRRVLGAILVLAGAGVVVASVATLNPAALIDEAVADSMGSYVKDYTVHLTHWSWLSVVGGIFLMIAGFIAVFIVFPERRRTAKYDRIPDASALTDWQSLDHGIDPTASGGSALD